LVRFYKGLSEEQAKELKGYQQQIEKGIALREKQEKKLKDPQQSEKEITAQEAQDQDFDWRIFKQVAQKEIAADKLLSYTLVGEFIEALEDQYAVAKMQRDHEESLRSFGLSPVKRWAFSHFVAEKPPLQQSKNRGR
jgi:hypothetical protein